MSDRNQGGIMGPGGRNVVPIYKPLGGIMGMPKIQGPQISTPKKNKPSTVSKIKKAIKDELFRPTQRLGSTD